MQVQRKRETARKTQSTDVSKESFILVFGCIRELGDAGYGGEAVVVVD